MKVTLEEFLDAKIKAGDEIKVELSVHREFGGTTVEGELWANRKMVKTLSKKQALRAMEILEGAK